MNKKKYFTYTEYGCHPEEGHYCNCTIRYATKDDEEYNGYNMVGRGGDEGFDMFISDNLEDAIINAHFNPNAIKFTNPSYNIAIIGITQDGNLIYDYEKMIEYLLDCMSEEEAIDFIEYNTLGILPTIPIENRPVILYNVDNCIIKEFL